MVRDKSQSDLLNSISVFVQVGQCDSFTAAARRLKITTSGWLVVAASGDATCGRATATCASGDLVEAMVDFMTVPAWPGT